MMRVQGWGGFPSVEARTLVPGSRAEFARSVGGRPVIARGMGRSYGDSASAETVLQTSRLDRFLAFDAEAGIVACEAGVTIRELLATIVPRGWFVPVTPGTSHVTIGGAIASDVHGKNHHSSGTFGAHVRAMTMLLGTGEIVEVTRERAPDLFDATCGGMGLTGVVLAATIALKRIESSDIEQRTLRTGCLEEACEQFEVHASSTYSVAWIDCLARGARLGRSVLMLGEHARTGRLATRDATTFEVPIHAPAALLNRWSIGAFNALYYAAARHGETRVLPFEPFFYPLDRIGSWNRLYGKRGFVQYQFVLPRDGGVRNMRSLLERIAASGLGSFLAVLKMFGAQNGHLLSFPLEGYTLALDFKVESRSLALLRELDAMVVDMGGRIYLTKDALMSEQTFKAGYPRWQQFEAVRTRYGAIGRFASAQSRRLGLR